MPKKKRYKNQGLIVMIPNVKEARERANMVVEMNNLSAKGSALLLESVSATTPVECKRLHEEAVVYLDQADVIRDTFNARFPNALGVNVKHG